MREDIAAVRKKLGERFKTVKTPSDIFDVERTFLGRKGELARLTKSLKDLPEKDRRTAGQEVNQLKQEATELIARMRASLKESGSSRVRTFDIMRPGKKIGRGHLHPLTLVTREVKRIFLAMGFSVVEGLEVETEWYNFDALNIPPEHPARDLMDTFWLQSNQKFPISKPQFPNESQIPPQSLTLLRPRQNPSILSQNPKSSKLLLRTHTSPMQVRYMESHQPPLRIIVPGRVFRYEASDASHDIQFTQVEGLMVDRTISVANFKAVIQAFFERFFKQPIKTRLRPGYFPFVEPGFEVDITCTRCRGEGCGSCKHSGWMELMGAGMVHQNVFKNAGYTPGVYMGFAFGMGLDRLAMVRYGIDDIRLFYGGDMRFLKQF